MATATLGSRTGRAYVLAVQLNLQLSVSMLFVFLGEQTPETYHTPNYFMKTLLLNRVVRCTLSILTSFYQTRDKTRNFLLASRYRGKQISREPVYLQRLTPHQTSLKPHPKSPTYTPLDCPTPKTSYPQFPRIPRKPAHSHKSIIIISTTHAKRYPPH